MMPHHSLSASVRDKIQCDTALSKLKRKDHLVHKVKMDHAYGGILPAP